MHFMPLVWRCNPLLLVDCLKGRDVIQYKQVSGCLYREQEQRQEQKAVNDAGYYDRNRAPPLEKLKNAGLLGECADETASVGNRVA